MVVTYPASARPDFSGSGGDQSTMGSKPVFEFSFIEYNFGECFLDQNGGVSEEETILTVRNITQHNTTTSGCHHHLYINEDTLTHSP